MSEERIRVFNLTDVGTPKLKRYHSVNVTFVAGSLLLSPGEMGETSNDPITLAHLQHYISIGAASVGSLPPEYVSAKEKMAPKPGLVFLEEKTEEVAGTPSKKGKKE